MKYSEFIKEIEDLGFNVGEFDFDIRVVDEGTSCLRVSKEAINTLTVDRYLWVDEKNIKLLEKAIELAKTPIEDREDEKLYYVKLIDDELEYLNQNKLNKICTLSTKEENNFTQTKFTEKEIKEIDERYWQFAVEVENEN